MTNDQIRSALDLGKLTNVKDHGDKITAGCPACKARGADASGNHLVLFPDGRFGCVVNSDKSHRAEVLRHAGTKRNGDKTGTESREAKPLENHSWSDLKKLDGDSARRLGERFGISCEALLEMHRRGVLKLGAVAGQPTWVVTDRTHHVRQDQRLDNKPIKPEKPKQKKRTLGRPSWPIGLDRGAKFSTWILTEGNTDFLAAFELMSRGSMGDVSEIGIACFLGAGSAGNPHPKALEALAGKNVIIAFDNDEAGNKAARKLFRALEPTARNIHRLELSNGCDLRDMVIRGGMKKIPMTDMRCEVQSSTGPRLIWTDEDPDFGSLEKLKALTPEVVLDGLLHAQSKLLIGGVAKIGKSLFAMDLACRLAKGQPFLEWEPSRPMSVIYVDAELHEWELKQRAGRCLNEKPTGNLGLLSLRGYPEWRFWDKLTEFLVKADGAEVIVIDCLYKFNDVQDENSNSAMKRVGDKLDAICQQTGAAVILVHHFGKGNASGRDTIDRFRGASSLVGEVDALISLTRHELELHYVIETEVRSFPPLRPFVAQLKGSHFWKSEKDPSDRKKPGFQQQVTDARILELIPEDGTRIELNEVAARLGISRQGLLKRVQLHQHLEVVKAGKDGRKRIFVYRGNPRVKDPQAVSLIPIPEE
jgi:hypothetical protein